MLDPIRYAGMVTCVILMTARLAAGLDFGDVFERSEAPWLSMENRPNSAPESEEGEIDTDRNAFTPATTTVAAGRIIVESSYSFLENRGTSNTNSFPELIARFGITKRLELRLGWNYEMGGGAVSGGDAGDEELEESKLVRETQLYYGLKYSLTEQKGWIPQSAFIVQGSSPTSGPDTFTDLQLTYVYGWTIFNNWRLDSSLRYQSTSEQRDHFNIWAPSVVLKIPVAQRWKAHVEYFGMFADGRADGQNPQYFSPGLHYLVTPRFEIGARVGWGLNQDAASFFTNVGAGLLF